MSALSDQEKLNLKSLNKKVKKAQRKAKKKEEKRKAKEVRERSPRIPPSPDPDIRTCEPRGVEGPSEPRQELQIYAVNHNILRMPSGSDFDGYRRWF